MPDLSHFHFLRPMWLWALIPAFGLWMLMLLERSGGRRWRMAIAPHLLDPLLKRPKRRSWTRPTSLALPCLLAEILALSGPAWRRQETPFVQDQAPLVVALDLSRTMDAVDVPPTRLERAKQKVRDLLALRPGARTALIAYAGSAHVVLPLTNDCKVIELYLLSLEPELMPVAGKDAARALDLAEEILSKETAAGTILFVTDGIGEQYASAFEAHGKAGRNQVLVLAVGTSKGGPVRTGKDGFLTGDRGERVVSRLDRKGLEALEARAGAYVVGVAPDGTDVDKLARKVNTHLESAQAVDERIPWEDCGYFLLFPVVPVSLLWFRRGWTIRWQ